MSCLPLRFASRGPNLAVFSAVLIYAIVPHFLTGGSGSQEYLAKGWGMLRLEARSSKLTDELPCSCLLSSLEPLSGNFWA